MNTIPMIRTEIAIENNWNESNQLRNFIVEESDNGTLFHRPQFMQYHGIDKFPNTQPLVISFYKKEKLIACIMGAVQELDGVKKFISPFGSSYGGLVYHKDLCFKDIEEIYVELLSYLQREYSELQIASTPFFQSQTGKSHYIDHILLTKGFTIAKSDIILVHELDSVKKLSSRFHKKTVTELKQPLYKNKLSLQIIPGIDEESYRLLLQAQERLQSKPTHSYEELLTIEELIPGTVQTYKSYSGNDFVAGIVTFRINNNILSTFYVFDSPEGRALKANHFSYYKVIKYAFQKGYRYVDFGSSTFGFLPNYPLISFKEKFDARPYLRHTFGKKG